MQEKIKEIVLVFLMLGILSTGAYYYSVNFNDRKAKLIELEELKKEKLNLEIEILKIELDK